MVHRLGPADEIDALLALRAKLNAADEGRDIDAYLQHCTQDTVAMPPGRPPVRGRENLRTFLTDVHDRDGGGDRSFEYESASLVVRGDQGFDHGTLHVRATEPSDGQTGSTIAYIDMYRRGQDGRLRLDGCAWFAPTETRK